MTTRAIIEFKDTYASMECHNLGLHPRETALAIISPIGQILSSTPLFQKAYGPAVTHIDHLPFNPETQEITLKGLTPKAQAHLEDWMKHTYIIPIDYEKHFNQHQELLHLLADSPLVEEVQSLTHKTIKMTFNDNLNDGQVRQLQAFILHHSGIYSYIGTSTVSDRNAHQALEWAKLDSNGRAHNNHKPAIFKRNKSLFGHFFHQGNQKRIA